MAFCVRCGVELSENEIRCPLCLTEPAAPLSENIDGISFQAPLPEATKKRLKLGLISGAIFLLPAIICALINYLLSGVFTWSLFVIGGEICAYSYIFLPLLLKKPNAIICLITDTALTSLFLLLVAMVTDNGSWLLPLGIPVAFLLGSMIFGLVKMAKTCLSPLHKIAIGFTAFGILSVISEALSMMFLRDSFVIKWSLLVVFPLCLIAATLTYIEHDKVIKDKIKRRVFF
ncbi:MAG: DUF6320 domain-containing protein [Oscillospiraceae bacterium]